MPKRVRIKVPGTSANLGPGFDTLGMAVNLFLTATASVKKGKTVFQLSGEGSDELPANDSNLIFQSYLRYGEAIAEKLPALEIFVENQIPLKRGLGSSSAAIAAGILLGQSFAHNKLSLQEIVNLASSIEGHPDNVTPCLSGGITVCCCIGEEVFFQTIRPPKWLQMVAVIPNMAIETHKARAILPDFVPRSDAVMNVQRAAIQVALWHGRNPKMLHVAFEDFLHQKYRKVLIPGFDSVFSAALASGARAVYLSGSGPTIIALHSGKGKEIGDRMADAFAAQNVASRVVFLKAVVRKPRVEIL